MGYKSSDMTCTSLYDRVKKLLVSFEWSDCSFLVAGTTFKAHKLILGISSPVFEAMFYGPMSDSVEIQIVDIEPDTFQLLLNYIYTDKVTISSIDKAFDLLYASRKYLLDHLSEMCIFYIQENLSIDNVIAVLSYPDYLQDARLKDLALKLFCEHANYLLPENKKKMSYSCMKTVLQNDHMNIAEKDLIKHVFEWTTLYCEQNNMPASFQNRHDFIIEKGLFELLRFKVLSLDDLQEIVDDENNILLPYEVDHIKKVIHASEKPKISNHLISIKPRNSLKLRWVFCHRSPLRSAPPIVIDSHNYDVHCRVKCNKSVFVNSLCVPSRVAPTLNFRCDSSKVYSEQFLVTIVCESDNSLIKSTNFMNTVKYDSMVDIELSEPCFIKKDQWYKISLSWPRNRCHSYTYIVECRDRLYKGHKATFEFDDTPFSGTGGSILAGIKYCL